MKWLKVTKDSTSMNVKLQPGNSAFMEVRYRGKTRGRVPDKKSLEAALKPMYCKHLSISRPKFNALLDLCRTLVIPAEFHGFYNSLSSSNKTRNTFDASDVEDNDNAEIPK